MKTITISSAEHVDGYKVKIIFNDKTSRIVDFAHWLKKNSHPQYNKYKELENFKKFKIEMGNIVWGKNWDLIFPVYDLYAGKMNKQ
jgi:hypothetical protein